MMTKWELYREWNTYLGASKSLTKVVNESVKIYGKQQFYSYGCEKNYHTILITVSFYSNAITKLRHDAASRVEAMTEGVIEN